LSVGLRADEYTVAETHLAVDDHVHRTFHDYKPRLSLVALAEYWHTFK